MYFPIPKKGELLKCPVCFKEFIAGDDTKYICSGGYVCEWRCFLYDVRNPNRDKTIPPPYVKITVDKSPKIEYNNGVTTKVDLFSMEEPPKKRGRKKKE